MERKNHTPMVFLISSVTNINSLTLGKPNFQKFVVLYSSLAIIHKYMKLLLFLEINTIKNNIAVNFSKSGFFVLFYNAAMQQGHS